MDASDCVKREHGNYELDRRGHFLTSSASRSSLSSGFSVSILYFLNYLIQFPDFGFSSVFFHSNVLKKIDMTQKSDSVSFQLAFTCSKSAIETLKKGVKYVQS